MDIDSPSISLGTSILGKASVLIEVADLTG